MPVQFGGVCFSLLLEIVPKLSFDFFWQFFVLVNLFELSYYFIISGWNLIGIEAFEEVLGLKFNFYVLLDADSLMSHNVLELL